MIDRQATISAFLKYDLGFIANSKCLDEGRLLSMLTLSFVVGLRGEGKALCTDAYYSNSFCFDLFTSITRTTRCKDGSSGVSFVEDKL